MSTPETQWILCPACHGKTRTQLRKDTVLQNFPLFCPKCKRSFLISLRECKTEYEIKPDAKTQAYWMEYEYELKEHGFSGEEDYILKLTDMPFEEMFQISKMPEDALDVHAGAFEIATMREIYTEAIRENALVPNGYVGEPKGSQYIETKANVEK